MKYKLTKKFGGGSLIGSFKTSYAALEKLLGKPNTDGDGYKVSTEWTLEGPKGSIFTIYDYKETNSYDKDYPSVEEFRAQASYDWHIGGTGDCASFIEWLKEGIKGEPKPKAKRPRKYPVSLVNKM